MDMSENFEYFVDEEKRTVVAVLSLPPTCIMEEACSIINKGTGSHFVIDDISFQTNMLIKGEYVGKAVCHPNDTFDIDKGMRIAKIKALRAYLNDRQTVVNRLNKIFSDVATRIGAMKTYTEHSKRHLNNCLKEFS